MAAVNPLTMGFRGFRPRDQLQPPYHMLFRTKLSTSTKAIKKLHPLITATGGTIDRAVATGTNEVQRITITGTPTGGSFTLAFTGSGQTLTTAAIPYNATAAQVASALGALANVGTTNISVTGGPLPGSTVDITFIYNLSARDITTMTATSSLTGGSTPAVAISTPTAGVNGFLTSTVLYGFSDEWDAGTIPNYPRSFAQAPPNLDGPFAYNPKEYGIFPALAGFVYTAAVDFDVIPSASLIDNTYSVGYNLDRDDFYIATNDTTTNPIAKVIGLAPIGGLPSGAGLAGGLVDFHFIASACGVSL